MVLINYVRCWLCETFSFFVTSFTDVLYIGAVVILFCFENLWLKNKLICCLQEIFAILCQLHSIFCIDGLVIWLCFLLGVK